MPRSTLGDTPMSAAERQARYRAARAAGWPVSHSPRPAEPRSRAAQWREAVARLVALQAQYGAWLDALPQALHASATGEALQAICDLDLCELQDIPPPLGFGRD